MSSDFGVKPFRRRLVWTLDLKHMRSIPVGAGSAALAGRYGQKKCVVNAKHPSPK